MFWSGVTRYSPLSSGSSTTGSTGGHRCLQFAYQFPRHFVRRPLIAGIFIFSITLLLFCYLPSQQTIQLGIPSEALRTSGKNGFELPPSSKLRLVIPATTSNANLCKSILSASVVNFTAPVLINWGEDIHHDTWKANGTHIAKITGILNYLDNLKNENEYDLVLIADGFDTWFQFGPEVIKSRYSQISKSLYERTKAMMGERAFLAEGITQSILFSAQKDCGPRTRLDDIGCYGQLESPLPKDLFGPDTDRLDTKLNLPLHFRSHFLCSGVMMGTVRDLRRMFLRATEKIDTFPHKGSDQAIFNQIFGEQNYQREVMRLRHRTLRERILEGINRALGRIGPSITDPHPTRKPMEKLDGAPLEFGIGLDYWLDIVHSTVLSEWDSSWLITADAEATRSQQIKNGHPIPQVTRVPNDVLDGPLPFEGLPNKTGSSRGKMVSQWSELPLYSNQYTGTMPAIVHMNGGKWMRKSYWDRMWYHKEMRHLMNAMTRDVGAWSGDGEWLSWDNLCKGTEEEVFRDLLGPWKKDP